MTKIIFQFIALTIILSSCSLNKGFITSKNNKSLINKIESNPIFQNEFLGFVLFDVEKQREIININGTKLFTPASNNKLLSFSTIYPVFKDSLDLPLLYYVEKKDSIFFWGAGNPTFLNTEYNTDTTQLLNFFSKNKSYIFCQNDYQENKWGDGWMWDDASYSFQRDRTAFPLFGNVIEIKHDSLGLTISPQLSYIIDTTISRPQIIYQCDSTFVKVNRFENKTYHIPFKTSQLFTKKLLENKYNVKIDTQNTNLPGDHQTLHSNLHIDSLYIKILKESDNFVTEQLMMMANMEEQGQLSVKQFIKNHSNDISDNLRWVDASGISRYNLVSPVSLTNVLKGILKDIGFEKIKYYFAEGGNSGTIKNWYGGFDKPYLWAKTGTLSNNHNISGYLKTDSGRLLIFSFMNNHYIGSSSTRKAEMQKIFEYIKENY